MRVASGGAGRHRQAVFDTGKGVTVGWGGVARQQIVGEGAMQAARGGVMQAAQAGSTPETSRKYS